MTPCLRCGKRREHAFHDPRARVYAEDRHEYDWRFRCPNCDRLTRVLHSDNLGRPLCTSCSPTWTATVVTQ